MALTWYVLFDWDGDGSFAHDEAARVMALRVERGRTGPWAEFSVGKCVLTLENNDRRFDPWYTGSPLTGKVLPRRRCWVQVSRDQDWDGVAIIDFSLTVDGTDALAWDSVAGDKLIYADGWNVFYGSIEDIEPMGGIGKRTVTITLYDGLRDMKEAVAPDIALQTNITEGAALALLLDAMGWPAGSERRDLEAGDTLSYWWTTGEKTAREEASDLVASEQGALFITTAGRVKFLARGTYWTAVPVWNLDQAWIGDIRLASPWTLIYNQVRLRCFPAALGSEITLWTLRDTTVYVPAGGSVVVFAEFTNSNGARCAASGVITPVATTDYTAGSLPGGGWNMTTFMAVAMTAYATEARLTISNSHATVGFYVLTLKARGLALDQDGATLAGEDAASQTTYGLRVLSLDAPWRQNLSGAQDIVDFLVGFYAEPHPLVEAPLVNVFPDMLKY